MAKLKLLSDAVVGGVGDFNSCDLLGRNGEAVAAFWSLTLVAPC